MGDARNRLSFGGTDYPALCLRQEAADVITGGKITESKLEELFDKVDGDKSGTIEYGKFKEVQFIDRTP